jgi:hypothetical protein
MMKADGIKQYTTISAFVQAGSESDPLASVL